MWNECGSPQIDAIHCSELACLLPGHMPIVSDSVKSTNQRQYDKPPAGSENPRRSELYQILRSIQPTAEFNMVTKWSFGGAPTTLSIISPSLNNITVGMLVIPYPAAVC